ncbi:MAG: DUF2207 domain-containing protein, partial [Christensenella sp.]
MKKILLFLAAFVVMLIPSMGFAADANYVIEDYHREITVHENNTYSIADTMSVDWLSETHGLRVDIPTRAEITRRYDGEIYKDTYQVLVSDITVDGQFETDKNGDIMQIKIGDPDKYVTGKKNYSFGYRFDPGDNKRPQFDEFYFNLIDPTWAAPINKFSFVINMPKDFDAKKIGFSTGAAGNEGYNTDALKFKVEGNTITGTIDHKVAPYEGVTVRIELPNGYYVGARSVGNMLTPVLIISGAVLLILLAMVFINDKRKRELETVEFNPPEGMNPADVGFIIDGIVEDKDAVSLLIYWADQGNIEIHGEDEKNVGFKKIKDLPETANDYERTLFDKMFEGNRETIYIDDMQYKFAGTIAAVKKRVKDKFETDENRVFTKKSLVMQGIATALSVLPMVIMLVLSIYIDIYDWLYAGMFGLLAWGFGGTVTGLLCKNINKWKSEKLSTKMGGAILMVLGIVVYLTAVAVLSANTFGVWVLAPTLITVVLMLLTAQMRRRTEQGAQWAGRILGLKHFIETVEADKLKLMVNDDPQYFYHILPYAYVLGVTDKWAKQFESIAVEPPNWYYGYNGSVFSAIWFASMMSDSMRYTQQNMGATKGGGGGIGGGGGFSGGGFSGGGFGGGGG